MAYERVPRLERLATVARAARSLELDPFLQTVIASASELTGSEVAAILEYDERGKSLRFLAVPPGYQDTHQGLPIPMDESPTGWVARNGMPLRLPDGASDPAVLIGADLTPASKTHSLLAVPLLMMGQVLGVLETVNKNQAHYTEEDVALLETLAAAATLAIDRNTLQRRLEASLARLSELDRLQSDFIAITSHELRTPLGVILGHASFLRESVDPELQEQVDIIIKSASRLKEIVASVASMENYRTGRARVHQQAIPIARIIAEVAASFAEMAADRRITLQVPLVSEHLLVEADHTKISIALGNLVKNAIAFTNEGGLIRIETDPMPGYVKVSVIDNGIGIPRRDVPRIFDRFFQVEGHLTRRHNGMGLGLSVAKVMVEMHGGRIWAESVEGEGSTFSFILPTQAIAAEPAMF